jgi:hypothetical protein
VRAISQQCFELCQTFFASSEESESESSTVPREERDFLTNPFWIEDPELKKGEVDFLSSAEIQFWKDLIDKYLYPIDQDKAEQVSQTILVSEPVRNPFHLHRHVLLSI